MLTFIAYYLIVCAIGAVLGVVLSIPAMRRRRRYLRALQHSAQIDARIAAHPSHGVYDHG